MAESGERRFLADKFTPAFLMDLCDGETDFQSQNTLRPFIGQWIRVRGTLYQATPNPAFGTAGVTIELPNEGKYRREAFLTFNRDLDRLAKVGRDEPITAEGQIKSVSSHILTLENCGLADPQVVSIRMVREAAEDLRKAVEDRAASGDPIRLKAIQSDPVGDSDDNATDLPDVDFEHLKLWWAAFSAAYPKHGEDLAVASARATFPKHYVRRQWVRDLRGPQPMGRPPKNKEK